ncbi:MAG TPA: hypothetical protein VI861_03455 [Rickettsiales bacterium]|nr:hypothetical protein [Rickettsiales bacterium]
MNKKFVKSLATAVAGLSLVSSCSMINKALHKCSSSKCSGKKKEDTAKCSSKHK